MKTKTNQPKENKTTKFAEGAVGLCGFIGFQAVNAFTYHNPWYLFMPLFFIGFIQFKHWHPKLKYLGVLGTLGLILGPLGLSGVIPV